MRRCSIPPAAFPLVAAVLLVMTGCDSASPQPRPVGTRMVGFDSDPFAVTGIRPDPDAADPDDPASGAIIVDWHPVDASAQEGTHIGGYYLYRSDTADINGTPLSFHRIANIVLTPAGSDTTYIDAAVRQNVRYSYLVTSYAGTDASLESDPSDTVSFSLLDRPVPVSPIGDVTVDASSPLQFRFSGPGTVALQVNEVLPTNETVVVGPVWRYVGPGGDFIDPRVVYTGDSLESGRRYRWRVDRIIQGMPQANASRWVTFSVK